MIVLPLFVEGELCCVLAAISARDARQCTAACVGPLEAFGEIFANAIARACTVGALAATARDLRETLEAAHLCRWTWDITADTVHLSDGAQRLLGASPRTIADLLALVDPDDRPHVERRIDKAKAQPQQRVEVRYAVQVEGGHRVIQQWHEVDIHADGRPCLVATISDVTASVRLQQEVMDLRTYRWHSGRVAQTGLLVASLAHELSQPLAAILNNAQAGLRLLKRDSLTAEEMRDMLEDIVAADRKANEVVGTLRAMLRRQHTPRVHFDASEAVQDVLRLVRSELISEQIELATSLPAGCCLTADKTQIEQVILNLVMNATDAMRGKQHGPRRLELAANATATGVVEFSVKDTGDGIPPDKLAHVFEAFWTTKKKGLGMGLSVSRSIVAAHGGRMWFETRTGQGSTFYFALPSAAGEGGDMELQSLETMH
jgi:PAS domain S-box-containing protein